MQNVFRSLSNGGYASSPKVVLHARELYLQPPHLDGDWFIKQLHDLEVNHDGAVRDLRRPEIGARGRGHLTLKDTSLPKAQVLFCVRGHLLGKRGLVDGQVLPVNRRERNQAAPRPATRVGDQEHLVIVNEQGDQKPDGCAASPIP